MDAARVLGRQLNVELADSGADPPQNAPIPGRKSRRKSPPRAASAKGPRSWTGHLGAEPGGRGLRNPGQIRQSLSQVTWATHVSAVAVAVCDLLDPGPGIAPSARASSRSGEAFAMSRGLE
jgi:hypothetical protein